MSVTPVGRDVLLTRAAFGARSINAGHRVIAATLAAALTLIVVIAEIAGPPPHLADASAVAAVETAIALSALATAGLLRAHLNQARRLRDLLLLAALLTAALAEFLFNAVPAFGNHQTGAHGLGPRMACSLLVTSMFVAAAYAPTRRRFGANRRPAALAALAGIAVVAAGELIEVITGPGVRAGAGSAPYVRAIAITSCCGLVIAAVGFASRRDHEHGEAALLAGASLLFAGASLQRVLLPLVPADWLTAALLFRLGAYGLLLMTALRLYGRTRDQLAREAISAERLRIARDLHDGLAQDLAFIAAHSERLARQLGAEHPVAIAAQRALAASRGTIVDLEALQAPSTEAALREVASELAARFGVEVTVRIGAGGDADPTGSERREIVRIAREAIVNAICHGGARHIAVTLGSRRSNLLLRVSDDGCGLGAPAARASAGTGLGMPTMRARARALGGQLIARRGDRGGTEIEVVPVGGKSRSPA